MVLTWKLEEMLNDDRTPWVEDYTSNRCGGRHGRIISIHSWFLVKQHYLDLGINVNWTIGTADLFLGVFAR